MTFDNHLRKLKIDETTIEKIINIDYPKDKENPKQDETNFMAAAMKKCEEMLDYDTISEIMFDRACCKSGFRLKNAKLLAKEHGNKTMEEKLILLGNLKHMGKPFLNSSGDIETIAVGN